MKYLIRIFSIVFLVCINSNVSFAGIKILNNDLNRIFVISIGVSAQEVKNNPSSKYSSFSYASCSVCLSDADRFPSYLKKLKVKLNNSIDSVISYSYINRDIGIDEMYAIFREIQDKAKPEDIFVFYYASSSWGTRKNENGDMEGFYSINNKLTDSAGINKYSFSLSNLKVLTDRIASERQLIIFDTGNGQVIAPDYYKIFLVIIHPRLFLQRRTGSLSVLNISAAKAWMKKKVL